MPLLPSVSWRAALDVGFGFGMFHWLTVCQAEAEKLQESSEDTGLYTSPHSGLTCFDRQGCRNSTAARNNPREVSQTHPRHQPIRRRRGGSENRNVVFCVLRSFNGERRWSSPGRSSALFCLFFCVTSFSVSHFRSKYFKFWCDTHDLNKRQKHRRVGPHVLTHSKVTKVYRRSESIRFGCSCWVAAACHQRPLVRRLRHIPTHVSPWHKITIFHLWYGWSKKKCKQSKLV